MSSISHRYADFSSLGPDGGPEDLIPLEKAEDQKVHAFEEGYQAGWADADKNHAIEQKSIDDEFLHSLRDLSFTYQEALSRITRSLNSLFGQMMTTLLPQTVNVSMRAQIIEQLVALAASQTSGSISIRVSDSHLHLLEDLLEGIELNPPVSVISDPTLSPNQLFVSLDILEREINLDAVCEEIRTAMEAFTFHTQQEHLDA